MIRLMKWKNGTGVFVVMHVVMFVQYAGVMKTVKSTNHTLKIQEFLQNQLHSKVLGYLTQSNLYPHGIVNAPVRKGKNIEYILYCKPDYKGAKSIDWVVEEVKNLVRRNSLGELE